MFYPNSSNNLLNWNIWLSSILRTVLAVYLVSMQQTVSGHTVMHVWPTSSLRQRRMLGAAFHFLILWWMWFPVWDWNCGFMTVDSKYVQWSALKKCTRVTIAVMLCANKVLIWGVLIVSPVLCSPCYCLLVMLLIKLGKFKVGLMQM